MSQSTELHVPDGYYPPFAVVTDTDHGAYIIIAVTLGLTGTVSGFAINYWSISDLLSRFLHLYSHVLF
jgi:hypothetical protein